MALEEMAKVAVAKWGIDNCKLVEEMAGDGLTWRFEQIQQPQPRTPRLVEAVEDYLKHFDRYSAAAPERQVMRLALAAEKKRSELVEPFLEAAKDFAEILTKESRSMEIRVAMQRHFIETWQALDAYEKGE